MHDSHIKIFKCIRCGKLLCLEGGGSNAFAVENYYVRKGGGGDGQKLKQFEIIP